MTLVKLNEQRQIVYSKQSGIMKLSFHKGEELQIMSFDPEIQYPIIISANIVYNSPDDVIINHVIEENCSVSGS